MVGEEGGKEEGTVQGKDADGACAKQILTIAAEG